MQIIARKTGRFAYPPIGRYIGTPPAAKSFEQHQIRDDFPTGIRLRPEGARQPEPEARILANIKTIFQGLGPLNGDWLNRG